MREKSLGVHGILFVAMRSVVVGIAGLALSLASPASAVVWQSETAPRVIVGFAQSSGTSAHVLTTVGEVLSVEVDGSPFAGSPVADLRVFGPSERFVDADGLDGGLLAVAADGGVFASLGAPFYGSVPGLGVVLDEPVAAAGTVEEIDGYWLVAQDGGVFAFGEARFYGSLPSIGVIPVAPIVDIVPTPSGAGYLLIASDGGVFAFGDAQFLGSYPGLGFDARVAAGMALASNGYWIVDTRGETESFGEVVQYASFDPSVPGVAGSAVTDVDTAQDGGVWISTIDGRVVALQPVQG